VRDLVKHHFNGNTSAPARVLKVHRTTVVEWSSGKQRPSPLSLLRLAYCFGGDASDWILHKVCPAQLQCSRSIPPALAEQIQPALQRHSPAIVRGHLIASIQASEYPPPSFKAACKQLGVDQTVAKRMFPDLAQQVMSRFRVLQTENRRNRENFTRILVESAVNQLLTEGRTLSYNQLCKVLPPGVSAQDKMVRCEFKRLRRESEDEMQAVLQESPAPCS
jgi:hypothetical protein